MDPILTFWEDSSCTLMVVDQKKVAPICQKDGLCPSGWSPFYGHCYLLVQNATTWADAEKDCYNKGGHLASVHSADENTFIRNLYSSNNLWIGGTDAALEVGFTICVQCTYFTNFMVPSG